MRAATNPLQITQAAASVQYYASDVTNSLLEITFENTHLYHHYKAEIRNAKGSFMGVTCTI